MDISLNEHVGEVSYLRDDYQNVNKRDHRLPKSCHQKDHEDGYDVESDVN